MMGFVLLVQDIQFKFKDSIQVQDSKFNIFKFENWRENIFILENKLQLHSKGYDSHYNIKYYITKSKISNTAQEITFFT